jgi:hypothetical protein
VLRLLAKEHRLTGLGLHLLLLMLALMVAALGVQVASAHSQRNGPADAATTATCTANQVHYHQNRDAGAGLMELPWVAAGRGPTRIVGYLFYYSAFLGDRRFNQAPHLVMPTGGGIPNRVAAKVLWVPRKGGGRTLLIAGRRLDGPGAFRHRESATGPGFPSIVEIPEPGCWQLTLKTGSLRARVVVQAVEPPAQPVCEATPIRHDPNPRLGTSRWIEITPKSAGLFAIGSVSIDPKGTEASIYPGRFYPGEKGTKILWVPTHLNRVGKSLVIIGNRLDGPGHLRQLQRVAYGQTPPLVGRMFPSIVNIPSPGCWMLTLRTGRTAGLAVFRAVEPGG